jgi:hypothetical protein
MRFKVLAWLTVAWIALWLAPVVSAEVSVSDTPATQLTGQLFPSNSTLRLRANARVVADSIVQGDQFQETLASEITSILSIFPERVRVTAFRALTDGVESRATVMFGASKNASDATPEQLIMQLRDLLTANIASLSVTTILQHVNASSMVVGECHDTACLNQEDILFPLEEPFAYESCMKKDCYWMIPFLTIFLLGWIALCAAGVYYCGACRRGGEPQKNHVAEVSDTQGGSVLSEGASLYSRPTVSKYSTAPRTAVTGSGSRAQPLHLRQQPDTKSPAQPPRVLKPRLKSTLPPKEPVAVVDDEGSTSSPTTPKKDDFSPSTQKRILHITSPSLEIAVKVDAAEERTETPVQEIEAGSVEVISAVTRPEEVAELAPRSSEEEDKV